MLEYTLNCFAGRELEDLNEAPLELELGRNQNQPHRVQTKANEGQWTENYVGTVVIVGITSTTKDDMIREITGLRGVCIKDSG